MSEPKMQENVIVAVEEKPVEPVSAVSDSTPAAAASASSAAEMNEKVLAAKRHIAAKKADETKEIEDEKNVEKATPFLEKPIEELRNMNAEQMQALMKKMVKETNKAEIEAQKKVHSTEIESMQKLMMEAQEQGLLDEEEEVEGALDENGVPMQTTSDGGIILKNKAGDHNPILDDLRKKQKRGLLSKEEEEMLEKAIAYQTRMTGAAGKKDVQDDKEDDNDPHVNAVFEQMSKVGDAMMQQLKNEQQQQPVVQKPVTENSDGTKTFVLHAPLTIVPVMRGIMMPMVATNGSAELPGNSLVVSIRIAVIQDINDDVSFVLGTTRNIANPQDADNKPQRWADTKNPITGAELRANGFVEIVCAENDVIFNDCMVGITLLSGTLPQGAITISVSVMPLGDEDDVGVVGPAAATIKSGDKKANDSLGAAVKRQKGAVAAGPRRNAPAAVAKNPAQKAAAVVAKAKKPASTAPPVAAAAAKKEEEEDSDSDGEVAGVDETKQLKPQLPPNAALPSAPTRKQMAADPNNPKFDPLPVKERLNLFSVDKDGKSIAPELPEGVAGYAADGTPIPIVNDGANYNPRIPDVFSNMEYRNTLMASKFDPEKDKPIFYNNTYKFIVLTVIGPKDCGQYCERVLMRVWGFAKTKKECATIAKFVRENAYMGFLWDIGVAPCSTFFPVPPIYSEDATSTYSNPLHKQYIENYINEQKRATIELEQRVLDDKVTREKSANTMAKQLSRTQTERKATVQKMEQQQTPQKAAASTTNASGQNRRQPIAQRIGVNPK